MLTDVSGFSNVDSFSDLDNLAGITLDAGYSSISGYTDADIDTVFAPEPEGLDRHEIHQ